MLEGRVAVITGAGRGLGAAIAAELAAQGASVAIADRDEELARATAEGLRAAGRVATPLVADVSDAEQVEGLFDAVAAEHGRLDILVNNAGVGAVGPWRSSPSTSGRARSRSTSRSSCAPRRPRATCCRPAAA